MSEENYELNNLCLTRELLATIDAFSEFKKETARQIEKLEQRIEQLECDSSSYERRLQAIEWQA